VYQYTKFEFFESKKFTYIHCVWTSKFGTKKMSHSSVVYTFVGRFSDPEDQAKFQKEQAALKERFVNLNVKALKLEKELPGIIAVYEKFKSDEKTQYKKIYDCKDEDEKSKMFTELRIIQADIKKAYDTMDVAINTLNSTVDECNAVGRKMV
jgi:predicted  nucleic acid-binding Zn-ribbon protein